RRRKMECADLHGERSTGMEPRRLRLAAIQMVSINGRVAENLTRAEHWAKLAAEHRAEVVLLPELFSTGFEINAHAWKAAEPQDGPTERWLVATARRHDYFIGGSYLEHRGDDFFDTFALAGPTGIAGRVRKRHPCSVEAYIFKGGDDPQVIETPLGRFGVAICYDASLREVWDRLLTSSPDLLLVPMSAPTPAKTLFYGQRKIEAFHASFYDCATQSARLLGIPCAMSNKWGQWNTALPGLIPKLALGHQRSSFPGFTHIADSNGREVARVAAGEDVSVATVRLDSSLKRRSLPPERERFRPWIAEVPSEYRFFAVFEALGRRWYARGRVRGQEKA
ncbi:MAG TPA: carbon-nitrogen hydrolase family protein, partial [Ramlibacter sp.]|nr:carbon-nitrogen hydrolase family protein [Ramlibacter sp.]